MPKLDARQLSNVKQIIECNDLAAVNVLLQSGNWILLNSYKLQRYGRRPVYCLGLIKKNEENGSDYTKMQDSFVNGPSY